MIKEIFFAAHGHERDEVFLRARVHLAAAMARVDKSPETNSRQMSGLAGGNIPIEV